MASFPELHGEATTRKTKVWSIRVFERRSEAIIETTHGYLDGKKQVNEKIITQGKNIGRANQTTPLQQAINEARSAWVRKKESGYAPVGITDTPITTPLLTNGPTKEVNEENSDDDVTVGGRGKGIDESVPSPMLAHDYLKRGKSITFPCFVQRKFDGTRCVAMPGKGLFSRNRKSYPHLEHITKEINRLPANIIFDGELYSDTLTFQEIVGLVKRVSLKAGDEEKQQQIKYFVYDIISDAPYEQRLANLQMLFARYKFKNLVLVKTDLCESEEKMKELHAQYVAEGYEGIMLRNKSGAYKNARSIDLQKYKCFLDSEFEITGYKEGEGVEAGCVLWVCKTNEGKTFACRPRGTREERMELFQNGDDYIGQQLTVRFQELTNDGVPRFPVGLCVRNYE